MQPSAHELESLGIYLATHLTPDSGRWMGVACNHTLRLTTAWLDAQGSHLAAWTTWLQAANIYCDCAMLVSVLRDVPSDVAAAMLAHHEDMKHMQQPNSGAARTAVGR